MKNTGILDLECIEKEEGEEIRFDQVLKVDGKWRKARNAPYFWDLIREVGNPYCKKFRLFIAHNRGSKNGATAYRMNTKVTK